MSGTRCIYCGSADTEDCGPISETDHHFECYSCHMAFPLPVAGSDKGETT